MKPLETSHTFAALSKIGKELKKILSVINIISIVFFSVYYLLTSILNYENLLILISNIALFSVLVATVMVDFILKRKPKDNAKQGRLKTEKKNKISLVLKIIKYTAKSITVGIAVYELISFPGFNFTNTLNVSSIVILVLQLVFEVIIYFVMKYFEYLKFAIELDADKSWVVRAAAFQHFNNKTIENIAYALHSECRYTVRELKIIEELQKEAKEYKKLKHEINKANRKAALEDIKSTILSKISLIPHRKIIKTYEEKKKEAESIIDVPAKIDKVLEEASRLIEKLPVEIPILSYIPHFISLLVHHFSGKYKGVSVTSIIAILGAVIYFISPVDIIPDSIRGIGFKDEEIIIANCLEVVNDELEKFIEWKNS